MEAPYFIFKCISVGVNKVLLLLLLLMRRLHLTRSCDSSPENSFSGKSFLMLSNHLRFSLPLLLFPCTFITLLPTYYSSLLNTCPYHFNLLSCIFLDISPTFAVPLILSSLVTPLIHLNILISATSNYFSCFLHCPRLGTVHHCWSYNCLVYFLLDSKLFFGRTESPISSSSFSILIVFYASSPHLSLHYLPIL